MAKVRSRVRAAVAGVAGLLLLAALQPSAPAATSETSTVATATAAAHRGAVVPERLALVSEFNTATVASGALPGQLTLVVHDDRVVQYAEAGWGDAAKSRAMQRDSLFRMYSMTKPITAVAVLQLMEDGKLLLGDPVARYLPAFADVKVQTDAGLVAPARPMTIRDLLTHTSGTVGLGEALSTPGLLQLDADTPMSELVDRIAALPLRFQPGARFEYGFGLDIAGVVVEKVSGQSLDDYFRTRIFEPLGMVDTAFYVKAGSEHRLVAEQTKLPTGAWTNLPPAIFSSDKVGARREHFGGGGWGGGVVSTIDDYSRFARMLANEGTLDGVRVLGRKSVELMTTNHTGSLATLGGPGYGHGLGVGVRIDVTSDPVIGSVGRFGWGGAGFTHFFVDPSEDLVALRFTNVLGLDAQPGFGRINPTFETLVYQALA